MSRTRATRELPPEAPAAPLAEGVRTVTRFEASLLRMLRSFLRPQSGEPAGAPPTAAGKIAIPAGLSDDCLFLIRDTLGKGCVLYLARAGGWRRERFLRAGQPVVGRLWERSEVPDLQLSFSPQSIRFLMWLAAGRPIDRDQNWDPDLAPLTIGDLFLIFLAYEGLREADAAAMQSLRAKPAVYRHGLVRLFFPEDFTGAADQAPEFEPWTAGVGAAILEALQPKLRQRWLDIERGKFGVAEWEKLRSTGRSQDQALTAFLTSCEAAKRPDLARFLLKALAELLSRDLTPAFWIGGLPAATAPARLADRLDTQRQALAVVRHIERLAGWARHYGGTKFFDEDYAIAQLFLSDWEEYCGDELAAIGRQLLRQLEPLKVSAPAAGGEPSGRGPESGKQ